MLRSAAESVALLVGGFARTAEAQLLVESGWAHPLVADRATVRAAMPRIEAAGDEFADRRRLGRGAAHGSARRRSRPPGRVARRRPARAGAGPRAGYRPGLACANCRRPAHCRHCNGPLEQRSGTALASCRWCGRAAAHWRCTVCAGTALRGAVVGAARTVEEIGRAFPGVRVVSQRRRGGGRRGARRTGPGRGHRRRGAGGADGGYGAALLLDGWALLGRPDLRAAEETLRRWCAAAALVRRADPGGRVVVGADGGAAGGAGADPMGPGRPRRPGTGRPPRAGFPAGGGDGRGGRQRRRGALVPVRAGAAGRGRGAGSGGGRAAGAIRRRRNGR